MKPVTGSLGLVLLLAAQCVGARVVFDNGVSIDTINASDTTLPNITVDDFLLAPDAGAITGIHWTGVYASFNTPTAPDDFTIEIFSGATSAPDGGPPVHALAVGQPQRVDTGDDLGPFDVYGYTVDIAPLALAPGAAWWLSIVNDTSGDADDFWFWTGESKSGNAHERTSTQQPWTESFAFAADFELMSVVAEPSAVALLGIGLAGLALAGRRRDLL